MNDGSQPGPSGSSRILRRSFLFPKPFHHHSGRSGTAGLGEGILSSLCSTGLSGKDIDRYLESDGT